MSDQTLPYWDVDEAMEAMQRGGPPRDECWIAADGRRLETKTQVLNHLVEIGALPAEYRCDDE